MININIKPGETEAVDRGSGAANRRRTRELAIASVIDTSHGFLKRGSVIDTSHGLLKRGYSVYFIKF